MSIDSSTYASLATYRAASLARMEAVTPEWVESPPRRSTELLWDFESGEAKGWAFQAGRWFRDALDIKYTPRSVARKVLYEWTQGGLFDFKVGYTTESRGWLLELGDRSGPAMLQVLEARPAQPADVTIYRWKQKPASEESQAIISQAEQDGHQWAWKNAPRQQEPYRLHVMSRRTSGVARVRVLIGDTPRWYVVGELVMSQDDLVRAIIGGLSTVHVAELKEQSDAGVAVAGTFF